MSQLEAARPPRTPVPPRTRRLRTAIVSVAFAWLLLWIATRSLVLSLTVVVMLAAAAAIAIAAGRSWGVTASHPWVRGLGSRPWRTGQEVWQLALKHLPETFIIAPDGSRLAADLVELRMNPEDYADLTSSIDAVVLEASSGDVYRSQIAGYGARYGGTEGMAVVLIDDPEVSRGRYRLRPRAISALVPSGAPRPAHAPAQRSAGGGFSWALATGDTAGHTLAAEPDTMTGPAAVPWLRLVTSDAVTQTRTPVARAGRGTGAELRLPEDLTVSRIHAEFSYDGSRWQIANCGRNGLRVNGTPVSGQHAVADGDLIHWGHQAGALTSLVQIGPTG